MSPSAPAPYSNHPRKLNGWYTASPHQASFDIFSYGACLPHLEAKGTYLAGPIHFFQLKPSGIGSSQSAYDTMPCGHTGRRLQACASTTSPIAPAFRYSYRRIDASSQLEFAVTCVATPALRAALTTRRHSSTKRVRGFTQHRCFFFAMAARQTSVCQWSGQPQ